MAKDKSRYFTFLLYPESIPEDWKSKLELIGVPIAISPFHDMDEKLINQNGHLMMSYEMASTIKAALSCCLCG